ncbi:MAG: hypothetical protein KDA37_03150 [Planctomycetales bacterium]|nr:hypothetical protein [Planctomycetales bacterium]
MTKQPILDELHAFRRRLLEESGGTLSGLVARLRAEQAESGRTILKAARPKPNATAEQQRAAAAQGPSAPQGGP